MEEMALVYTTWPDAQTAEAAARQAIAQHLAACANILGPMHSIFRWDGGVHTQDEVAMILKTRMSLSDPLRDALVALHPYETPCIVLMPINRIGSNTAFLAWIEEETTPTASVTWPTTV
ncbi:MAG TPA: divalent-cation tolerance protein CutA [Caulobacteraceae bacterium]|nr:divalent-cation tolerance protein CutA [Caulobacteraceae bacterium]